MLIKESRCYTQWGNMCSLPYFYWCSFTYFTGEVTLKCCLRTLCHEDFADVYPAGMCQVTAVCLSSLSLSSIKGQQDRADSRLVVRADHQHQWCHAVWRRHVHLLSVHHAGQNGQSLPDCSRWVTRLFFFFQKLIFLIILVHVNRRASRR